MAKPMKLRQGGLLATAGTLGFLLGLLFARKSGSELRKDMAESTIGAANHLSDLRTQLAEKVGVPIAYFIDGARSRLTGGKAEENQPSDVSDLLKPRQNTDNPLAEYSQPQHKPSGLFEFYKQRRMQVPGRVPQPRKLFGG